MWAMLLAPLFAAALSAFFLRRSKWGAAAVSVLSATFALILAMGLLLGESGDSASKSVEIFKLGGFSINFGFLLDEISKNMVFVVCFVGWLIHIFSVGYMDKDDAKGRFFGGLSFFMFSMTGIMLADNLFMMFIFWEFVGFSSYMLIAHYADTEYSKMASKKAFIANRVGDFGFLIGIIWCYHVFGTTEFGAIATALKANPSLALTPMALLLICGFLGKSAQFPLQVWLTDAMAGPTPVSALIHAATMVAAGVFMTVRLGVVGLLTPVASGFMVLICSLMAMCAGFWALGQRDIKKTLAYSTLAHLGLMGVAVGLGAYGIAMMHLTMHAFFKAALFLVAGSVIYACHHEQDMFKMGGLARKMPITALAAFLATCSIISVPFFAGYYSKEMILNISLLSLVNEYVNASVSDVSGLCRLGALGAFKIATFAFVLIAALLTPLYMARLFFAVFLGKPMSEKAVKARENSLFMTIPLVVLGVFSLAGAWGAVFGGLKWLGGKMSGLMPLSAENFMAFSQTGWEHFHKMIEGDVLFDWAGAMLLVCTLILILIAYFLYGRGEDKIESDHPIMYHILEKHGWFDDVYNYYVLKVQQRFAVLINALDMLLIQGFAVKGLALISRLLGLIIKSWHVKWVSSYVVWMLLGLLAAFIILAV